MSHHIVGRWASQAVEIRRVCTPMVSIQRWSAPPKCEIDARIVRGFCSESGAHYLPMRGVVLRLTIPRLCCVAGLLFAAGCGGGEASNDVATNGAVDTNGDGVPDP